MTSTVTLFPKSKWLRGNPEDSTILPAPCSTGTNNSNTLVVCSIPNGSIFSDLYCSTYFLCITRTSCVNITFPASSRSQLYHSQATLVGYLKDTEKWLHFSLGPTEISEFCRRTTRYKEAAIVVGPLSDVKYGSQRIVREEASYFWTSVYLHRHIHVFRSG